MNLSGKYSYFQLSVFITLCVHKDVHFPQTSKLLSERSVLLVQTHNNIQIGGFRTMEKVFICAARIRLDDIMDPDCKAYHFSYHL